MKISCNILKKHIKNSEQIDFLRVWDTFTIRTAEVEGVEVIGDAFEGVITAKIVECEAHPESKKLHVLKVDNGKEILQVVCGAANVRVGLVGAYAQVGSRIGDITLGVRPLGGIDSNGMLCGADELGIDNLHETIIELPEDSPLGVDVKTLFPFEDIIVEIDNKSLTNRPDLWGHYGIAREIAAITGHELIPLETLELITDKPGLNIKINEPALCYRYMGTKIEGITNNQSPIWLQIFLYYVGMRSINLIVDITNYVMLELGQPMHAFDARSVKDIEIGLAEPGAKFKTLDGVDRTLTSENLMIKNGGEYFAVAGVMGGLDSEILPDTKEIILESATFEAASVRKTATSLGLRTEASSRYEKSLDPNMAEDATKRYLKLLQDENPALELGSAITDVEPEAFTEKTVTLTKSLLYKYMGFAISDEEVTKILESLSFKVKVNKDNFEVIVPTFRATKDVTMGADLIEEISRSYGYENFTPEPLKMDLTFTKKETTYDEETEVKNLLAAKSGLHEVHTYLWNKTSFLKTIGIEPENVKLLGKQEDNVLRSELALSLLEVAEVNTKNYGEFGIFEIGTVIKENEDYRNLGVLLACPTEALEKTYNQMKALTYSIFKELKNLEPKFEIAEAENYYNNALTQNVIVNNMVVGQIKVFNRNISNKINKKRSFVVLELDFALYTSLPVATPQVVGLSKYPSTTLDYTLLVERGSYYEELERILNGFTSPIIMSRELIDIYLDGETKKVTIRYVVGSPEKTLTGEELNDFKKAFIKYLQTNAINIIEE